MAGQVKFFHKNLHDIQNVNVTATVTDSVASSTGEDIWDYTRNRNNYSAWLTTGSADSGNTTIEVNFGDFEYVDTIILVKHNWDSFTIQYWNGSSWVDFSTAISESGNTDDTTAFTFTEVSAQKIKIIITGTQTADVDKELYQLIVTKTLGQLEAWPEIKKPMHVSNMRKQTMLSGKLNLIQPLGRFSVQLAVKYWKSSADLTLVESLYFNRVPYLMWLCGGDETQFDSTRIGYRLEDLYLVRPTNDYTPEWVNYIYTTGLKLQVNLDEVVD